MIWTRLVIIATLTLGSCAVTATANPLPISENWRSYPIGTAFLDGATFGPWVSRFNGLGKISIVNDPHMGRAIQLAPMAATSASVTHAALVTTAQSYSDFDASVQMLTVGQLRTPEPNGWEDAWLLWHFTDNQHFYYFILNPTGWELGKEDATVSVGRRFLITGASPVLHIGTSNTIGIIQRGSTISITIDGKPIIQYTDYENPYLTGELGFYCEDATARFTRISLMPLSTPSPRTASLP